MSQKFRLENGGLINRNKKLSFKFNGKTYFGYEGDTLASALIANGVHLVGRSFKYHRPRGFFGAGVDEPYAMVQLYRNNETEPNVKATEQELFEGLEAKSVNCWPSVNFDIGAINNFLKIFLPAGFYYKTFMWPKSFWYRVYEPFIRKAAGLGVASTKHDKERYEHKYEYCDLLIAGSGPSGLASAYAAAKNGARVILAEDRPRFGGSLLTSDVNIGNQSGEDWANSIISDCGLTLESKIIGLIPFFLNSIAVSYPLSLFVKTNGFLPTKTPYTFKYSFAAEDNITPGVSLFPNTSGLSIDPEEIKTSFALIYQSLCFG